MVKKNLKEALKIEKEYLDLKSNKDKSRKDIKKFLLHHKLKLEGFETLQDYHEEKEKYILNKTVEQIKFKEIELPNLHKEEDDIIKNNQEKILFAIPKEDWVFVNYKNEELPDGIKHIYLGHSCRNIVSGENNINFAVVVKQKIEISVYEEWFKNKFKELGIKIIDLISVEIIRDNYHIYYIQVYLTKEEREELLKKWLL